MAKKSRFIPKNPQKYVGNSKNILCRSSWEARFCTFLDTNPAIINWASEEWHCSYVNPIKSAQQGRRVISQYYPDFIIKYKDANGAIKVEIIEIKPMKESVRKPGMSDHDKMALAVNEAKWEAATIEAKKAGATFRVVTEASLFWKPSTKAVGNSV